MVNVVIFASGYGTNFMALATAIKLKYHRKIDLLYLFTNNKKSNSIEIAKKFNVPYKIIDDKIYTNKIDFNNRLLLLLEKSKIDYILLAGYMKIIPETIITKYKNMIINIHPSILPKYVGLNALNRSIDSGDKYIGSTVHYVIKELDAGKIIAQSKILNTSANKESLIKKFKKKENELFCSLLPKIANKEL